MVPPTCGAIESTAADPLIHRPLDSASRQIRLLKLHPGTEEGYIECHLEHTSLEENPEFMALSYVWGDPTDPRTILLHNEPFLVTKNLHAALRSIRSRFPGMSTIWVDALCINQQDLAERSRQVPLMQFIYSQAKHTVVWFGPGNELSKAAVQLIMDMKNILQPNDNLWFNDKAKEKLRMRPSFAEHPLTHLLDRLEAWEAFAYLVHQPWWTRVWIAQEIKYSKDPILYWGEDAVDWIHCEEAMLMAITWFGMIAYDRHFEEVHGELQLKIGIKKAAGVIRLCQHRRDEGPRRAFLYLMDSFWLCEATDPRDKVYALLGLGIDSHSESIIPNYESPVSLVYAQSVRDIIIRERNLKVFSYCSGQFIPRDAAIPSWAPDWRSRSPLKDRHMLLHIIDNVQRRIYTSAKPEKYAFRAAGDSPPAVGFCQQMKTLYTVGIRVDVILKISCSLESDSSATEWSTLFGIQDHTNLYRPTGQSSRDACIETMSAGLFTSGSQQREILDGMEAATRGRILFVGEAGYQGLALSVAQIKDVIVVLLGGACPLILREMEGHYIMVGEAYGTWSTTIDFSQIHH